MAFMTPLVNKRYDIYEPAKKVTPPTDQSTFHLKSLKLVNKLVRIVINGNSKAGKVAVSPVVATPVDAPKLVVPATPTAKSAPVAIKSAPKKAATPISIPKSAPVNSLSPPPASRSPKSPTSPISPPSRPIPHLRRTMRDTATNRVYSYSVSIPSYVPEEDEEDLEEEERITSAAAASTGHSKGSFISSSAPNCFDFELIDSDSQRLAAPH